MNHKDTKNTKRFFVSLGSSWCIMGGMCDVQLMDNLFILSGAVQTGVLRAGTKALLFDCCETVTPERLAALGITQVELICCTQPRRPNVAGAYAWAARGAGLVVAAAGQELFAQPEAYWAQWKQRYDIMQFQPVPQVPVAPLPVTRAVDDGEVIEWEGYRIRVVGLPGPLHGAVAYLLEGAAPVCFSGDYLYGPGQFYELYPFQSDYLDVHGFRGEPNALEASLGALRDCGAAVLVPSHGEIMRDPAAAIALTLDRLHAVQQTYAVTGHGDESMRADSVDFVQHVGDTTSLLVTSESGDALLVDCGDDTVVWALLKMRSEGAIRGIDAAYITHYHCDHVWGLGHLHFYYPEMEVIADAHLADVLRHPSRYRLPCISHRAVPLTRPVADGETWQWREFTLTSYHFPSQTLYHDALLVEGHGRRVLFAGDSFGPGLWLADYCPPNRNLLGEDEGFFRCLRRLREMQPELIYDAHGQQPFRWTPAQWAEKEAGLRQRAALLREMLPWEHPNFGLDEGWIAAYPYQQDAGAGATIRLDVRFHNHAPHERLAAAEPVVPAGWALDPYSLTVCTLPAGAEGHAQCYLHIPLDAAPGPYVIPLRITWNGHFLGQVRHAVVTVFG